MRIVFDTNVLLAAFIARGVCHVLFEHCIRQHELVTSDFIIAELREKLTGKFKYTSEEAEEVVTLLLVKMEIVVPTELAYGICRDPEDDYVIATVMAGNCTCIVTGDKDLLVLARVNDIDMVAPAEFQSYEASQ